MTVDSAHLLASTALDRTSVVPLYYQLQEILKEQIESGRWQPGDALPTEMDLTRQFGVSRVCVRQALAILEDDREIVRIQGRGTFVAARKLSYRPVPLVRFATDPAPSEIAVRVLDRHVGGVERNIATLLDTPPEDITRVTTLWSAKARPFAIGQTFLPPASACLFSRGLAIGQEVGGDLTPARLGLLDAEISVETTQCGQFEADILGLPSRSTLLLTLAVQLAEIEGERRAIEVSRLGYRGDAVQLRLGTQPGDPQGVLGGWIPDDRTTLPGSSRPRSI